MSGDTSLFLSLEPNPDWARQNDRLARKLIEHATRTKLVPDSGVLKVGPDTLTRLREAAEQAKKPGTVMLQIPLAEALENEREDERLTRKLFDALGFNPEGEWEPLAPFAAEAEKALAGATVTEHEIRFGRRAS